MAKKTKAEIEANKARLAAAAAAAQERIRRQVEQERLDNAARRAAAALASQQAQLLATQRAEVVSGYVRTNNAAVQAIATQVLLLRTQNPLVQGINAGNNAVGNTAGGTGNPIAITIPANDYGITVADVAPRMTGFDNSDSGVFKFRVSGVLVHGA